MNRDSNRNPLGRRFFAAHALTGVSLLGATTLLSGCGEDPPPPAPIVDNTPPPPPPPPPAPPLTPVVELMATYGIDPRIEMPEVAAPGTDEQRIAILQFYDALVRGESGKFVGMLSEDDQAVLNEMVAEGAWNDVSETIGKVDLRAGNSPLSEPAVVAVIRSNDGDIIPQGWTYATGEFAKTSFTAIPTPMKVLDKMSGDDWIGEWYRLLQSELALASVLDEELEAVQVDRSTDVDIKVDTGGGGGQPMVPPDDGPKAPPPSRPTPGG